MKDIIINSKKVYDSGKTYINCSEELEKIKNNLNEISKKISEGWSGDDSHNFIESFNAHIYELNNLINFLDANGEILKHVSLLHDEVDDDFAKNVERSDLSEI